ncbi:toprim domain-containing protein, partial [Oscillospiraceae bacterium 21-37]
MFVGQNSQGKPRHIHMRGTLTGSGFRQTLAGSEKACSFNYVGTGRLLYVFEAPIDLLSYISLHPEDWQENSYVALCGVGISPIERLLDEVPQLEEVILCLDNDQAGH